jgi:hypothetical protein
MQLYGTPEDQKALFTPAGGTGFANVARALPATIASFKGAEKGATTAAKLLEEAPIPKVAKAALVAGAAITSAGVSAGTATTALEEAKRLTGVGDDRSDSFSQSLDRGFDAAKDYSLAEFWGRVNSGVVGVVGFRPRITPESMANMEQQKNRFRAIYEKTAGTPLLEDPRSYWNPMRYVKPMSTELDDTQVVKRLKAAGYDPEVARSLAINGGAMGDLLDNSLYESLQRMVGNSKASRNVNATRGQMMQDGIRDLGSQWGSVLPPEDIGKAVYKAVKGDFSTLAATRQLGMNSIDSALAPDFKFRGKWLKAGVKDLGGPEGLVAGLSDTPTFMEVQQARENLGAIMHDETRTAAERAVAAAQAKRLDQKVRNQLPPGIRDDYRSWAGADDEINRRQFNQKFVQGLMTNPKSFKAYANQILAKGDLTNFKQFEAAAGPQLADQVRANIWDRVTNGAVEQGGVMRPDLMRSQLYAQGKYGKTFLEGVMGKKVVVDYEGFASAMEKLNDKAHQMGMGAIGTGKIATVSGMVNVIENAFKGKLGGPNTQLVAAMLGVPAITSRILASPTATKWAIKIAQETAKGTNPARVSRATGYLMTAAGLDPGDILAHAGVQVPQPFQTAGQLSRQIGFGPMGPQTGNPMTNLLINPAAAMSGLQGGGGQ